LKKILSLWKFGFIEGIIIYFWMLISFIPIFLVFALIVLVFCFPYIVSHTVPSKHILFYLVIFIMNLLCIIWLPIAFGFIINKRFKSWIRKNKDIIETNSFGKESL
jgi:hypothetical protein